MLFARSPEECHLYMRLRPCACGEEEFAWSEHLRQERGERVTSTYRGVCGSCAAERSFEFEVPAGPIKAAIYGAGDAPSKIIDPGEFLAVSSALAERLPDEPGELTPDELDDAIDALEMSVAALAEVLKFIPAGADAVPAEAFTSTRGTELHRVEPERFTRERLESALADRRAVLAAYEAASSR